MSFILIVGSSNTDMVIQTDHLPTPGETIIGGTFFMNAGGKGANQAVAAARLGAKVKFIAKTGNDIFGQEAREHFQQEGIDISHSVIDDRYPSGVALITIDKAGENTILVASGSNGHLLADDIPFDTILTNECKAVLVQLEIPIDTVSAVVHEAYLRKIPVILNPAPAISLGDDLLKKINILTPNEIEASMLSGVEVMNIESAKSACAFLHAKGVDTIVLTMGSKGALIYTGDDIVHVAAPEVKAIDTTAAGDVFNGALASAISSGRSLIEAVEFACKAASISVTRLGAQQSVPFLNEM